MDNRKPIVNGVVSKSILERAEKRALNLDWYCIPPEDRLLPDSIFSWVAFDEPISDMGTFEAEGDSSNDENIMASKVKHPKLQVTKPKKPLAPANRFETVTTSEELASFSE